MDTARLSPAVMVSTAVPAKARPRVCIVAHAAWGAMTGGASGHAGGVEHQTTTMARWLASRGFDVTLLVWDEGQPAEARVDGVRVLKLCRRADGLPGLRFIHPRWTSLNHAMALADADLYYQNCGEYVTGQVALWCRRHRRRFVFSVASDPECDPRLPALDTFRERILYRFGLRSADRIIVQTRRQQRMLKDGFGLDSIVLPMPSPDPVLTGPLPPAPERPARFVWVGRVSREKKPGTLLQVASALPDVRFDLVGPSPDAWAREICARAGALPNVRVAGRMPRSRMHEVYRGAAGLICTSEYEGFPNTFLEAWSYGVPVVSTVDPDDLLTDRGLGLVARNAESLAEAVRTLAEDREGWRHMSERGREYYLAHHSLDRAVQRFSDVFVDVYTERARG